VCPAIEHSTTEGVNRLITYLLDLDEGSNVTWLKTLPEVLPEPQDQLLVVADALLIAGVRNYDLALVSRVLSLVAAEDCPLSDTAIEATQFLLRQQVPCGAIGAYFVSEDNIVRDEAVGITACLAYALLLISKRLLAAQPVTAKSL